MSGFLDNFFSPPLKCTHSSSSNFRLSTISKLAYSCNEYFSYCLIDIKQSKFQAILNFFKIE